MSKATPRTRSKIARLAVRSLLLALGMWTLSGWADSHSSLENRVKAAFLFNFTKFVEWPADAFADARSPIVIAVVGDDRFAEILEQTVKDKNLNGRSFQILRVSRVEQLGACHIAFLCRSEQDQLARMLKRFQAKPVLTISEIPNFVESGGVINFIMEDNKVRFEINLTAADQARLKVSSKLLKLATKVQRGEVPISVPNPSNEENALSRNVP